MNLVQKSVVTELNNEANLWHISCESKNTKWLSPLFESTEHTAEAVEVDVVEADVSDVARLDRVPRPIYEPQRSLSVHVQVPTTDLHQVISTSSHHWLSYKFVSKDSTSMYPFSKVNPFSRIIHNFFFKTKLLPPHEYWLEIHSSFFVAL